VKSGTGAVLVPPRPNLGPEPMPARPSTWGMIGFLLIAASIAIGLLGMIRRYRRPGRRDRLRAGRAATVRVPAGPFASRRDQMAAWSAEVRAALADRFGGHWLALTTEEIAADRTLTETLGTGPAADLIRFLIDADRAKFDDREGLQPPRDEDVPGWLSGFVASSVPAAGARSMIKGK